MEISGSVRRARENDRRTFMASMLKFDSERRELVRERRDARIERKRERREARELKRSQGAGMPPALSATQRLAEEQVRTALDRVVVDALESDDRQAVSEAGVVRPDVSTAAVVDEPIDAPVPSPVDRRVPAQPLAREPRTSRREREIAEFSERRQETAREAGRETRARIARQGEPSAVADALAAIRDGGAEQWGRERELLERALASGKVAEVGAVARRALWEVSRDAARTSRRAARDPELAAAVCVCYAIVSQLPRTAVRSQQRVSATPRVRGSSRRPFWR
jgi:hypothetical protein